MKRLNPTKTILLVILAVFLILIVISSRLLMAMSRASFESVETGGEYRCNLNTCVPFHHPYAGVQESLGMSTKDFDERFHFNNESLEDLAIEAGVEVQTIIDILVANETAWIDQMVDEGFYTATEAEGEKENLVGKVSVKVYSPFEDPFSVAADAISVDYGVFMRSLGEGLTPADFSEPYGVHPEAIYEAVLRNQLDHIDVQVKYGVISESDAETARNLAPEFAHDVVYTKWFQQRLFGRSFLLLPIYYAAESLRPDSKIEEVQNADSIEPELHLDLDTVVTISGRALNIDNDSLQAELDAGKKLAEVAIDHQLTPQVVIDELALAQLDILDELVANGRLSEDDKETLLLDQNFILREIVYEVDLSR